MVIDFYSFNQVFRCQVCQLSMILFVFHAVCEEKAQSFYTNATDGVASLVEIISSRLNCLSCASCLQGVKGASSFTDVELRVFGTRHDVYNVVCQAVELFRGVHLDLGPVTLVLVQMMDMFHILLDCMEWSLVFLWLVDAV